MLDNILKNSYARKAGVISQVFEFLEVNFFTKKTHRVKIKKAKVVYDIINTSNGLSTNPAKFFSYIRKIDPFVFEELLLIAFKAKGIRVIRNKRYTGDGGIDGKIIMPDKSVYAVQAKRYQSYINPSHIKQFKLNIRTKNCDGGVFIHTGKTGKQSFSNLSPNVQLISGEKLHKLLICK